MDQIKEILLGVQYLHAQEVLHGSLQPSNILIQEHGHAVISDFALSRLIGKLPYGGQDSPYYHPDSFLSPLNIRYQAPEISNNQPMTTASDLYSWAMTALEILSGCKFVLDMIRIGAQLYV